MKSGVLEFGGRNGAEPISFSAAVGVVDNDAVAISAAGTCARGTANDALLGQVIALDADGVATVKTHGELELTFTGTFTAGTYAFFAVDGTGKVKTHTVGRQGFILCVSGTKAIILV